MNNLRAAQKALYEGGNIIIHAGLHLQNTPYEKAYDRIYKAINALNKRLIKEINK